MRRLLLAWVPLAAACVVSPSPEPLGTSSAALSTGLVISQIYGAGGNAGATYEQDFVELFNRGTTAESLSGLSVQYASATGTTWSVTTLPSVSVPPGGYFLVALAKGTTGTALPTADATGTINMGAANGRIALAKIATALSCSSACAGTKNVIDLVGWGTAADHEGSGAAKAPADGTQSLQRKAAGCTETADNANDWTTAAVAPRNSGTTPAPCGTISVDSGVDTSTVEDTSSPPADTMASDGAATDDTSAPKDDATSPTEDAAPSTDAPSVSDSVSDEDAAPVAHDSAVRTNGAADLPAASPGCSVLRSNEARESSGAFALFALATALLRRRRQG